jgi:hypothetical protein
VAFNGILEAFAAPVVDLAFRRSSFQGIGKQQLFPYLPATGSPRDESVRLADKMPIGRDRLATGRVRPTGGQGCLSSILRCRKRIAAATASHRNRHASLTAITLTLFNGRHLTRRSSLFSRDGQDAHRPRQARMPIFHFASPRRPMADGDSGQSLLPLAESKHFSARTPKTSRRGDRSPTQLFTYQLLTHHFRAASTSTTGDWPPAQGGLHPGGVNRPYLGRARIIRTICGYKTAR